MKNKFWLSWTILSLLGLLSACGGSEENARPDPIEMSQFKQGTTRIDVIGAVGKPEWTVRKAGRPCDVYKLYTRGISSGGKAALAVTEGITDVATLGLAEVAWSGIHAGTRPDMHTVLFCYGQPPDDDALVDIYDKNPTVERPPTHTVVDAARYAVLVVVAAPGTATPPAIPALPGPPGTSDTLAPVTAQALPTRPADADQQASKAAPGKTLGQ